jgi:long-chain acyl-CoA synthetase
MLSMIDRIRVNIQSYPDNIALTLNQTNITYHQLGLLIDEAIGKCQALNINSEHPVALVLPNMIETVVLFYALNHLGVTIVMCHPLSSSQSLRQRCELLKCKKIFLLDAHVTKMKPELNNFDLIAIPTANITHGWQAGLLTVKSMFTFKQATAWTSVIAQPTIHQQPQQVNAVVLFSSGTSGKQKGIMLSNEAFNQMVDQMEEVITPERGIDSMLCVLPFFHGFGLAITMHTVLALGGRCILIPRLIKKDLINTLLKEQPTYLAAVPYLLKVLLNNKQFNTHNLSFIKQVFVGGEYVPLALANQFNQLLSQQQSKACVQVGYGCTETLTAVTLMPPSNPAIPGIGLPLKNNSIRIVDEQFNALPPMVNGEITISGPTLMNGYADNESLTQQVIIILDNKPWYLTGDIGYLDHQGILHFLHRKDQLIKNRGYIINPDEVTELLLKLPGITQAELIVDQQECLTAIMTIQDPKQIKKIQQLTAPTLAVLDDWCIPRKFYIVKSIPLNEMKKTDRLRLQEQLNLKSLEFLSEWSL